MNHVTLFVTLLFLIFIIQTVPATDIWLATCQGRPAPVRPLVPAALYSAHSCEYTARGEYVYVMTYIHAHVPKTWGNASVWVLYVMSRFSFVYFSPCEVYAQKEKTRERRTHTYSCMCMCTRVVWSSFGALFCSRCFLFVWLDFPYRIFIIEAFEIVIFFYFAFLSFFTLRHACCECSPCSRTSARGCQSTEAARHRPPPPREKP